MLDTVDVNGRDAVSPSRLGFGRHFQPALVSYSLTSTMRFRHPTAGPAIVIAACLAAMAGAAGLAQTAGTASTGLLMGVIVDAISDAPVANAQVTLGGASAVVRNTQVLADAEGRFVFLDLPRGTYTITATKAGYADGAYGRRRPGGLTQTVALADAMRIGDLRIPVWKHGAITGMVRDEAGDPMVDLPVRVLMPAFTAGKLKLVPGAVTRTDDRGIYRLGSLVPGDYIVVVPSTQTTAPQSVVDAIQQFRGASSGPAAADLYRDLSFSGGITPLNLLVRPGVSKVGSLAFQSSAGNMRAGVVPPSSDGRFYVYPAHFFPAATTSAQATAIAVRSGEERSGVDMQLRLTATSRVSGSVTGPSGPLIAVLTLSPAASDLATDNELETATTLSDAAGRFTFLGVPPGQYRLRAIRAEVPPNPRMSRGAPPPPPKAGTKAAPPPPPVLPGYTLSATQALTVDTADIDDLTVTLRPGFRVSGRAEFANAANRPEPEFVRRMSATFDPADARPLFASTLARGTFEDDGQLWSYQLPPGRYYVRINNPPPGWTLKSVLWNGQDISNVPFTLDRDVSGITIAFTERPSTLAGQAQNASGAADPSATVLVFPADPGSWADYGEFPRRLRAIRVDNDGRYSTTGLPAGKYLVAAVVEDASANWQNPQTLQVLVRLATAIAVSDGESRELVLKTVTVPAR